MLLSVNVDHIATIRQARQGKEPDPVIAGSLAMLAGADGITAHLREDRRHVNDRDIKLLREIVTVEFNLEMAATAEMFHIATTIKPDLVTLVPEKRQELTTEGGLDIVGNLQYLKDFISALHDKALTVSVFIDPEIAQIDASKQINADMIELHTGNYANATNVNARQAELAKIAQAVSYALDASMTVNAGHGLNYHNVKAIASLKGIRGLYIGHSIISRSAYVGIVEAVKEMKRLIK